MERFILLLLAIPLFSFAQGDDPLPVEWGFVETYVNDNNEAVIYFEVESQLNNRGFSVEKYGQDNQFENGWYQIATMDGEGTTQERTAYSILDTSPNSINYYRIAQIDFDGTRTYSESFSLYYKISIDDLTVQNPFSDVLRVDRASKIVDMNGNVVVEGHGDLDTSELPSGTYILIISDGYRKIIKQ